MRQNPTLLTDGYKTGHVFQYPKGTEYIYSNFTPRSAKNFKGSAGFDSKVVFFGLQAALMQMDKLWRREFFSLPVSIATGKFRRRMDSYLGEGVVTTDHMKELHSFGCLPIEVKALEEGSRVDIGVPLWTIENTDPRFYWVTNYLETYLSAMTWLPMTSATTAYEYARLFRRYAMLTGGDLDFVRFQGHDFSMRGMAGVEAAMMSGAGHLTSFYGTDTLPAIDYLEEYYYASPANEIIGQSVPATEHSVMCCGGPSGELETIRHIIKDVYPNGPVSVVSDTWDFFRVITDTAQALRPEIMSRNGKVIFRPDSGDPVKIVCGDPASQHTPENMGALNCLWWRGFGGVDNDKGYRNLDSHVGLIYGEKIDLDTADEILHNMERDKFCSTNIVFGIGSYQYQYVTRDTFGCVIKTTGAVVNGEERHLFKNPKTDDGTKKSKTGWMRVERSGDKYVVIDDLPRGSDSGLLTTVYNNGDFDRLTTLKEIRSRLWA